LQHSVLTLSRSKIRKHFTNSCEKRCSTDNNNVMWWALAKKWDFVLVAAVVAWPDFHVTFVPESCKRRVFFWPAEICYLDDW
jgi:hypothetical protein